MARASSVALALGVRLLCSMRRGDLDGLDARLDVLRLVAEAIEGIEAGKTYSTRRDGRTATLHGRLAQDLPSLLKKGASLAQIQEEFWSGAYVLESGPMAFACFLASPEDFGTVVIEAGCQTRDSDTVAAIAGNLAGAFVGVEGLRQEWLDDLEYRDELIALAKGLSGLALSSY